MQKTYQKPFPGESVINSLQDYLKIKFNSMSEKFFQILVFVLFVVLEILIAVFFDTNIDFDAVSRVKGGLEYYAGELGLDFVQWLPFFKCGHIWLPLFQWLIGLSVVFPLQITEVSLVAAMVVGETISALSAAGTAIYVYRILRDFFELNRGQASLGFVFLLVHGQWVAHGSQAMTEILSIFLLVATTYHMTLFLTRESSVSFHLILATLFASLNNLLRYEAWVLIGGAGVLLIGFQMYKMLQARKLDKKAIELIFRLMNFLLLPSLTVIIWELFTFKMTGSFTGTTDWIIEHTGNWGLVSITALNPFNSLIVFFTRLSTTSIFWILIPWLLLRSRNFEWLKTKKLETKNFIIVQWCVLSLFASLTYLLIVGGISTSSLRHFLFVVPYVAITGGVLCAKETIEISKYRFTAIQWGILAIYSVLMLILLFLGASSFDFNEFYVAIPYLAIVGLLLLIRMKERTNRFSKYLQFILYASLIVSGLTLLNMHWIHLINLEKYPDSFIP
ncbi:MAG: hypothetical protein ACFFCZ_22915 [Promethearchaeota archaeon]